MGVFGRGALPEIVPGSSCVIRFTRGRDADSQGKARRIHCSFAVRWAVSKGRAEDLAASGESRPKFSTPRAVGPRESRAREQTDPDTEGASRSRLRAAKNGTKGA